MFKGLYPGKPVPTDEIEAIVEAVALRYESLAVLNEASLGEMFDKIIDRFEMKWNVDGHLKEAKQNPVNPNDHAFHRKQLDSWERLLQFMDDKHLTRREFLGFGKKSNKDKNSSKEPELDLNSH